MCFDLNSRLKFILFYLLKWQVANAMYVSAGIQSALVPVLEEVCEGINVAMGSVMDSGKLICGNDGCTEEGILELGGYADAVIFTCLPLTLL